MSPGSLPEPEELARFREVWKAELQLRKHIASAEKDGALTNPVDPSSLTDSPSRPLAGSSSQLEQQGPFDAGLRLYRQVRKTFRIVELWG
jgi:hypothetical protein